MRRALNGVHLLYRRFVRGDRAAGAALTVTVGRLLYPGLYVHDPRLEWMEDADFRRFADRFAYERGTQAHRRWSLLQLARIARRVPGDTAECGVYAGSTSWLICATNRGLDRVHHGFDSFEGLSAPGPSDGSAWSHHELAISEAVAQAELQEFGDAVRLYRGWIPERFDEVADRLFALVHLDVDLKQPTLDSLEFFYDRMPDGAILVCDDYGFTNCPGVTSAADEFLADRPEKIISSPVGGGFFVKGLEVAPRATLFPS